VPKIVLFLHYI